MNPIRVTVLTLPVVQANVDMTPEELASIEGGVNGIDGGCIPPFIPKLPYPFPKPPILTTVPVLA